LRRIFLNFIPQFDEIEGEANTEPINVINGGHLILLVNYLSAFAWMNMKNFTCIIQLINMFGTAKNVSNFELTF